MSDLGSAYHHVTGDGQLKATKGVLRRIILNGLTTEGDCTVYDSLTATGNVVAVLHLDTTESISVQPITLEYDARLYIGLYLDYDATLAADLTVITD